jgi:WD40 repeat protein
LRAGETGKELTVLNLASGDKLSLDTFPEFLPESTSRIVKAQFSPDLNLLAAIFSNSELETYQLRVWDLETGTPLQQIILPEDSMDFLFTPNGENLVFLANGIIHVIGLPEK